MEGHWEFLTHWKGIPEADDVWEPLEIFENEDTLHGFDTAGVVEFERGQGLSCNLT